MKKRYERKSIYEIRTMSDDEFRTYRKTMRLKRERKQKIMTISVIAFATIILAVICAFSYGSLNTKANQGYKYYTQISIESGDTLWTLADHYIDYNFYENKEEYISEVRNMNHLKDDNIYVGQNLIVPYYSAEFIY